MKTLLRSLLERPVSVSYATWWEAASGGLEVDAEGYNTLTEIVSELRRADSLATYPRAHLRSLVAYTTIRAKGDVDATLASLENALKEDYGLQRALVPFWGVHIAPNLHLDFGPYRLRQLGTSGFEAEIMEPFREFRTVGDDQLAQEIDDVTKSFEHVPNAPILAIDYPGASEGAADFVAPVAERIAEFLQFLAAPLVDKREDIKIIDHRGTYFGRYRTIMPVMTRDFAKATPYKLSRPNIREGNIWPRTLTKEHIDQLATPAGVELLNAVPIGPSGSASASDMLLRAIQLFADGERAVSRRQAVASYVGACDALFGHRQKAQLYTCTGMALALGGEFGPAYQLAKDLYDMRSRASHEGITPEEAGPARRAGYLSIWYVLNKRDTLTTKKDIRKLIERHLPSKRTILFAAVRSQCSRVVASLRRSGRARGVD